MTAWSIIADGIHLSQTNSWDESYPIVKNARVDEYLASLPHDRKYFIVSPKGVGKTLLLKKKSHIYRTTKKGMIFLPHDELIEKIQNPVVSFSTSELNAFKRLGDWEIFWKLCLTTMILKGCGYPLPERIQTIIKSASRLNEIFGAFLQERKSLHELNTLIPTELMPSLDLIDEGVAAFIDNIDEGLNQHSGDNLIKNPKDNISHEVWINAQLGFIEAVKSICETRPKIKIFASIRWEAFKMNNAPTAFQINEYATILEYNVEDLRRIFIKNIELTSVSRYVVPFHEDPFIRFFGYNEISNIYIKKSDRKISTELIFNYLLRHSFFRPRELMYHGDLINQIDPDKREASLVRNTVNSTASTLFTQYKREFIPYFMDDLFHLWCNEISKNILTKEEFDGINKKLKGEHEDINKYFYKSGFIGVGSRNIGNGEYLQNFIPGGMGVLNDHETVLPNTPYYYIHPCLYNEIRAIRGDFQINSEIIVGQGYPGK